MKSALAFAFSCLLLVPTVAFADEATPEEVPARDTVHGKKTEPVHVGAYAGVGFPSPMTIGGMLWFEKTISVGAEYGFYPGSKIGSVDVTYRSFAGDVRIFPLQSPFFFGVRVGRQHVSGATTISVPPYGSGTAMAEADTWYVNPRVGFLWTTSFGLTVGMDAGLRIPTRHSSSNNLPNGVEMPAAVANVTNILATRTIPTVTLLQLGLQF